MRLDAFRMELPRAFGGDLSAPHPRDRRFRALLDDVPGMATESKLALLNLAAAHLEPGEAYLEVGSFKGLSLIGAMLGNQHARFYAVENFVEFNLDAGATRDELLGNLDRWVDRERLRLLEGDCFRLLRRQRRLADRALVVVDDASWPMVAHATERYLAAHPGYELLFDLAAEREEDPRWWNGLRVYGFRRPPGQAAGRRASPDVAWRMLAYGLAYQPAVRLAWKTLPHHPRLASAVLKVVPMASRRVPGCG